MPVTPAPITTVSGNPLIDAMLITREALSVMQDQRASVIGLTAYSWGGAVGVPVTLTYSYAGPGSSFAANYPTQYNSDIRTVPDVVRSVFDSALQAWASVANVTFQQVQESAATYGDIRIGVSASNTNFPPGQAGAEAAPPASFNASLAGDVWLSPAAVTSWDWSPTGSGRTTALHEIGHAVFNLADVTTDRGLNGAILPAASNFRGETVMSYSVVPGLTTGQGTANQGSLSYWPTTPMVLDILAAQWLYGANTSYRSGDDVYTFSQGTTAYMTLWDGGGNDTISIAGNTRAGLIDLRPGAYSDVGSVVEAGTAAGNTQFTRTVGIAYGATIEGAIGGSGNDTLIGNAAANLLRGNGGNDTIDGGAGIDTVGFNGPRGSYTVTLGSTVQVRDNAGNDGTDSLLNVEFLQFTDQTIMATDRLVIDGDGSNNTLIGSIGNDIINGLGGDDTITGGEGNDTIDGGSGFNTAKFSGIGPRFEITVSASGTTIRDKVGREGTDTLINIQTLQFSDQSLDLTWFAKTASLSASQIAGLIDIYVASFNRAPDAIGLDYWGSRLKDGMPLADIAKSFFAQPEAAAFYPAGQTTQTFVTSVYNNVLNRAPDAAGLGYWTGELQVGRVSKDGFLLAILEGAKSFPSSADASTLQNKELVGGHFALTQGLSNTAWSRSVMSGVTSAASTVTAANQMTDGFATTAASTDSSELVVKILGIVA